jgi:hypothetical protein
MKRLTLTLVIFVALATVSQAQTPPPAATGEPVVAATDATASCDGCADGHKWHLFHHHSWSLFGHSSGGFCAKFNSKLSSLFNNGPPAPAGQPAFPTHPYMRGPRDFFMYE